MAPERTAKVVVREIEPGTPEYAEATEVRYEALYREWGLPRALVADTDGRTYRHVAAFDDTGRLVGYGRVWLEGGESKIFQVSVVSDRQGAGIGATLVEALVEMAAGAGRTEVVLDARAHVVPFYEKQGFAAEGDEFISGRTGTPHRFMKRAIRRP